jgi:probable F420-dependent oxidoreductase
MSEPLFSFAIYPYDRVLDPGELARVVKAGEDAGFDIVNFPYHLLPPHSSHEALHNRSWWDTTVLAGYLAGVTSRLRFLTTWVLPYYPPVQLAKAIATLDNVSNGRVIVSVGAGWYEEEFAQLGVPFAERGPITDEYLEAMIELWTADEPRFDGRYVSFEGVSFYPKPVQKPHPPLFIAGTGPRAFRRAVAHGDGWYPMAGSLAEIKGHIGDLRAKLREAGRDRPDFVFAKLLGMGADSEADDAARHVSGYDAEQPPRSPEEAVEHVSALVENGVNFAAVHFGWETPDELVAKLEEFGRGVIAKFR